MADFADLLRYQIGFVVASVLPSALLGLFPAWMAVRRGRHPLLILAPPVSCVAVAFAVLLGAEYARAPSLTTILLATWAALLIAFAWSFVLR